MNYETNDGYMYEIADTLSIRCVYRDSFSLFSLDSFLDIFLTIFYFMLANFLMSCYLQKNRRRNIAMTNSLTIC